MHAWHKQVGQALFPDFVWLLDLNMEIGLSDPGPGEPSDTQSFFFP
jgi:hypothetical protein